MRQLTLNAPNDVAWLEVPEPELGGPGEALVRPVAVALCDLDQPMVTGRVPAAAPMALGHEGVAEVVEVGPEVTVATVGDLVVVPFQPSCGTCAMCVRGQTGDCLLNRGIHMYGFGAPFGDHGGFLSDVVRVPWADAMLVPVPDGVDPAAIASASDNIPDAYRGVAPGLAERPGADVLVIGGGCPSIGLYAAGLARALGAAKVTYADSDPARLAIASDLGAEPIELTDPPQERLAGHDVIVDASCTHEGLACACRSLRRGGFLTSSSMFFEQTTPVPLFDLYNRGVTFRTGRAMARPAIEPVLELVRSGRFKPELVTDATVAWDDAATAVAEPHTKLIITR